MKQKTIPRFETEQEEAEWHHANRRSLDAAFSKQAEAGHVKQLSRGQVLARLKGTAKVISLRVPEEDLVLAREQAARRGLPYQTYLKSLLHEALRRAG
jgi:predicted DNA binding CopG/RHH family protein